MMNQKCYFLHVDLNLNFNETLADPENTECWSPIPSEFANTIWWAVFCVLNLLAMKLVPYALVTTLNILILVKLRKMWKAHDQLSHQSSSMETSKSSNRSTVNTVSSPKSDSGLEMETWNGKPTNMGNSLKVQGRNNEEDVSQNLDSR